MTEEHTGHTGVVKSIGMAEDDQGRTVMRAIVDFYDGAAPKIKFSTVWSKTPVTIVEVQQSAGTPTDQ